MSRLARFVLCGLVLGSAVGCQRWQSDPHALTTPQPRPRRLEIRTDRHRMPLTARAGVRPLRWLGLGVHYLADWNPEHGLSAWAIFVEAGRLR